MRGWLTALVFVLLLVPAAGSADVLVPPGFTVQVYVTGTGFEGGRGGAGIPSASTLAFDEGGVLYLARTGRRYFSGEVEDLWPIYRVPPGGAHLTPETESRYFYGPPLPNPQVAAVRGAREVLVTTFDRDRRVGVLYRLVDGRAELLAGGTPERGRPALLVQPEGVAVDAAGGLYVADRERGRVLRLDASGAVLDPQFATLERPRLVAVDPAGRVWIGADGTAPAPWQPGQGEIRGVTPAGAPELTLTGPVPAGMALSPGGHLFVADRHGARLHLVTGRGALVEFARFTMGDAPRAMAFAPVTAGTRRAGVAGDLFVVTIRHNAWPLNEVVRISGPFDEFARERQTAPRP